MSSTGTMHTTLRAPPASRRTVKERDHTAERAQRAAGSLSAQPPR